MFMMIFNMMIIFHMMIFDMMIFDMMIFNMMMKIVDDDFWRWWKMLMMILQTCFMIFNMMIYVYEYFIHHKNRLLHFMDDD